MAGLWLLYRRHIKPSRERDFLAGKLESSAMSGSSAIRTYYASDLMRGSMAPYRRSAIRLPRIVSVPTTMTSAMTIG